MRIMIDLIDKSEKIGKELCSLILLQNTWSTWSGLKFEAVGCCWIESDKEPGLTRCSGDSGAHSDPTGLCVFLMFLNILTFLQASMAFQPNAEKFRRLLTRPYIFDVWGW